MTSSERSIHHAEAGAAAATEDTCGFRRARRTTPPVLPPARPAAPMTSDPRRALPSVSALLESEGVRALLELAPRTLVVDAVRSVVGSARESVVRGSRRRRWTGRAPSPTRSPRAAAFAATVINATGIVLHTNLGRARLARRHSTPSPRGGRLLQPRVRSRRRRARLALRALRGAAARAHRRRGRARRQQLRGGARARAQHARATGARRSLSRGELVEIGGSFRVHEIMAKSGARAARGRRDEPHASRRLRARHRRRHRRHPQGASQQLRARRASSPRRRVRELAPLARDARPADPPRSRQRPAHRARRHSGCAGEPTAREALRRRRLGRRDERRQAARRTAGGAHPRRRAAPSTRCARIRSRARIAWTS